MKRTASIFRAPLTLAVFGAGILLTLIHLAFLPLVPARPSPVTSPFALGAVRGVRPIDAAIPADSPLRSRPILKADAYSTHFMNPDGTNTAVITELPHNTLVGSQWVPIDATLKKSDDPAYDFQTSTGLGIYLTKNGSVTQKDRDFVNTAGAPQVGAMASLGGKFVSLPALAAPRAETKDNTLTLRGEGMHVTVYAETAGAREDIVLETKNVVSSIGDDMFFTIRAPISTTNTLEVNGKVPGENQELNPADVLSATDGTGRIVFPFPQGQDANGMGAPLRRFLKKENGAWMLYTAVPASWLRDAKRAYPVTIDPDFAISSRGIVYSSSSSYATALTSGTATATNLGAGQKYSGGAYSVYRGYLRFDTSSVGSNIVSTATITLKANGMNVTDGNYGFQIRKYDWSALDPISSSTRAALFSGCQSAPVDQVWRNTADVVLSTYYISPGLDTSWINRTGYTYYCLTSSQEGTPPTGSNDTSFSSTITLNLTYTTNCPETQTGINITGPCAFSGYTDEDNGARTVAGIDNGNIQIATAGGLSVLPNQTVTWDPAHEIKVYGPITIWNGGVLKETNVWRLDQDHDNYGGTSTAKMSKTLPADNYKRFKDLASLSVVDCADSGTNSNQVMFTHPGCAPDIDRDNWADTPGKYTCLSSATCATASYGWNGTNADALATENLNDVTNVGDCDNTHPEVYQTLTCYGDADGDGYSSDTYVPTCMGQADHAVTTCAAATDGVTSRGTPLITKGSTVNQFLASNTADCDDQQIGTYKSSTCYVDQDGDGYSTGTAVTCIGKADHASNVVCTTATSGNSTGDTPYAVGTGAGYIGGFTTTNGNDCDDTSNPGATPPSAGVYTAATCYMDTDGDGYAAGTASYSCIGKADHGAVTCSTATAGNAVAGATPNTFTAGLASTSAGTDCDDSISTVYTSATCYSNRDGDAYASYYPTTTCIGKADHSAVTCGTATYGKILTGAAASFTAGALTTTQGTDCNDNPETYGSYYGAMTSNGVNAHWRFDFQRSVNYRYNDDRSTHHLEPVPVANLANAGKYGSGVYFDGAHKLVGSNAGLNNTTITIMAWVYLTGSGTYRDVVVTDSLHGQPNYCGWWFQVTPTNNFAINYGNCGGSGPGYRRSAGTTTLAIPVNQWTHIAAVMWGPTSASLFMNGTAEGSISYSGTGTGFATSGSTQMYIGGGQSPFTGYIDDVRISTSQYNQSIITEQMNNGSFPTTNFYYDADNDGYGAGTPITSCYPPVNYSTSTGDCNDANANVNPLIVDTCGDGIDQDCNGVIDDGGTKYYRDQDGDGYGNPVSFVYSCSGQPGGYVTTGTDCMDTNGNVHPNQTTYFSTNRGDGSFDYDCSGSSTPNNLCGNVAGWSTGYCSPACTGGMRISRSQAASPACGANGATWYTGAMRYCDYVSCGNVNWSDTWFYGYSATNDCYAACR